MECVERSNIDLLVDVWTDHFETMAQLTPISTLPSHSASVTGQRKSSVKIESVYQPHGRQTKDGIEISHSNDPQTSL